MEQKHRRVHGQTGRTHAVGALVKIPRIKGFQRTKNPGRKMLGWFFPTNLSWHHEGKQDHRKLKENHNLNPFWAEPWEMITGWWFQIFYIFTPTWGNHPFWLYNIFQRGWNHQLGLDDFFIGTFHGLGEHLTSQHVIKWCTHHGRSVVWLVIFYGFYHPMVNHPEKPPLGGNMCVFFPANFKQIYVCCFDG